MYIPIEKKYYLSNKEIAESLIGAVIGSINPKQELGNSQNGEPNEISLSKDNSISSTWNIKFIEKMYEELTGYFVAQLNSFSYKITNYDLCIINSVITYLKNYEKYTDRAIQYPIEFSTTDIIRQLKTNYDYKPSNEEILYISGIMEIIACTRITISYTNNSDPDNIEKKELKDYLLDMGHRQISIGNGENKTIRDKWQLRSKPILLEYAETVLKRVRTIEPIFYPQIANKTQDYITLEQALAHQVHEIIKGNYNNKCITYEQTKNSKGLLKTAGIFKADNQSSSAWCQKKAKVHRTVCKILDSYINDKLISGYIIRKKGQSTIGVEISLPKTDKPSAEN